ncbi:hypothetical protein CBL_06427 [Carabus blaptoides fortunei]
MAGVADMIRYPAHCSVGNMLFRSDESPESSPLLGGGFTPSEDLHSIFVTAQCFLHSPFTLAPDFFNGNTERTYEQIRDDSKRWTMKGTGRTSFRRITALATAAAEVTMVRCRGDGAALQPLDDRNHTQHAQA